MKSFVKYCAMILLWMLGALLVWHVFFINYWSLLNVLSPRTWIWGDSQMVQGIDPEVLSLHKDAYSNARHGNGYYDLVSFANRLPSGSDALIGIGPLYYRYSQDRSQAGLQLDAIRSLYEVYQSDAYEVDFKTVLRNNILYEFSPSNFNSNGHGRYPNKVDSAKRQVYISKILEVIHHNSFDALFDHKDRWLRHSIEEMMDKAGRFTLVSFPVCEQLSDTDFMTIQEHYDETLVRISEEFELPLDTLHVEVMQDPFYDATHFSDHAVCQASEAVRKSLNENEESGLLVISFNHIR